MPEERARLNNLPIRFPNQFPADGLPWGFQVDDGWEDLIVILCERINTVLKEAPPSTRFEFTQIKEKFGTLRAYYRLDHAPDDVKALIRQAVAATEKATVRCCEHCGGYGLLRDIDGYMTTLCDACLKSG